MPARSRRVGTDRDRPSRPACGISSLDPQRRFGHCRAMIRSLTMLSVLRREALPFVLACALALMLQLTAMPLTLAKAGGAGDEVLSSLCLGGAGASAEEAQPASGLPHHAPGFCPCGPVCAHSGSLVSAVVPSAVEPAYRAVSSNLAPLSPRSEPAVSGRVQRSGAIRAPPSVRT